jgi:hypothetical protein
MAKRKLLISWELKQKERKGLGVSLIPPRAQPQGT